MECFDIESGNEIMTVKLFIQGLLRKLFINISIPVMVYSRMLTLETITRKLKVTPMDLIQNEHSRRA